MRELKLTLLPATDIYTQVSCWVRVRFETSFGFSDRVRNGNAINPNPTESSSGLKIKPEPENLIGSVRIGYP